MKLLFSVYLEKPERVDMYLSTLFPNYTRSFIQKIIDKGDVLVNGVVIIKNIKVKNKDNIEINFINEKLDGILPEKQNLDIVYEDDNLLVINKNSGINVHPVPGLGGNKNTLVNGVLYHCKNNLPTIKGVFRPGIVHRLDKDTSGLILIAKNDYMMDYLSKIIQERKIIKNYIAVVYGVLKEKEFKIDSYIGRDPNNRQKMTVKNSINPKIAISTGKVIGYIENKYTVLKINIETGRTHQIRVHLSSIGFPIIGDKVYGNKKINEEVKQKYSLNRQALHAYELIFTLYKNEVIFKGNLKEDIKKIVGDLI